MTRSKNDRSGTMTTSAGARNGPNGPSGEGDKLETAKGGSRPRSWTPRKQAGTRK